MLKPKKPMLKGHMACNYLKPKNDTWNAGTSNLKTIEKYKHSNLKVLKPRIHNIEGTREMQAFYTTASTTTTTTCSLLMLAFVCFRVSVDVVFLFVCVCLRVKGHERVCKYAQFSC